MSSFLHRELVFPHSHLSPHVCLEAKRHEGGMPCAKTDICHSRHTPPLQPNNFILQMHSTPSSGQLSPNSVAQGLQTNPPRNPGAFIPAPRSVACLAVLCPLVYVVPGHIGGWEGLCREGGSCDTVGKSATASDDVVSAHSPDSTPAG